MKKKIILLTILLIPSLIYFFFELTQANFKKLPHYGPKTVNNSNVKDTMYYVLPEMLFTQSIAADTNFSIPVKDYPVYAIAFIDEKNRTDGFKLRGLVEYTQLKKKDIEKIPLFLVVKYNGLPNTVMPDYCDSLKIQNPNIQQLLCTANAFETYRNNVFKGKPYYIMDHFLILIDKNRHVRGYYDGSFVAEVKRLLGEFEHLKLRDERNKMEEKEKIEQH